MTPLKEGDKAPFFKGLDQNNKEICLDDFKDKKLILYFYPKDNTSACTAEACDLSENYDTLTSHGYEVVGVSPDSICSHKMFTLKYNLLFHLIADTEKKIIEDYGVWGLKRMYGRKTMCVLRTTFIICEGIIVRIINRVNTKNSATQILKIDD